MKKLTAILLGAAMLLSLAACGSKTDDQTTAVSADGQTVISETAGDEASTDAASTDAASTAATTANGQPNATTANATTINGTTAKATTAKATTKAAAATAAKAKSVKNVSSLEALQNQTGAKFTTPGVMGVSNQSYTISDYGTYKVAAYKYTVGDKKCQVLFSSNLKEDISNYIIDGQTAFASSSGEDEIIKTNVALARWFTTDGQYVFIYEANSVDKSLYREAVNDAKEASRGRSAGGDASIEGNYTDSNSQRATLTVTTSGKTSTFTIIWSSSATETSKWVMHVTKGEDGLYNYSDCKKVSVTDGVETTVYSNGNGYFEYSNGKLLWTGASEDSCKNCVFVIDQ